MSEEKASLAKLEITGGVATVAKESFASSLPEGLTEETFDKVDAFRTAYAIDITNQALDEYEKLGGESEISVLPVHMGGNTTFSANISRETGLIAKMRTNMDEELEMLMERCEEMVTAGIMNTATPGVDDDDDDYTDEE